MTINGTVKELLAQLQLQQIEAWNRRAGALSMRLVLCTSAVPPALYSLPCTFSPLFLPSLVSPFPAALLTLQVLSFISMLREFRAQQRAALDSRSNANGGSSCTRDAPAPNPTSICNGCTAAAHPGNRISTTRNNGSGSTSANSSRGSGGSSKGSGGGSCSSGRAPVGSECARTSSSCKECAAWVANGRPQPQLGDRWFWRYNLWAALGRWVPGAVCWLGASCC